MVFNYGPRGASGEHIDFNPGIGGGKLDPRKHLLFTFNSYEDVPLSTAESNGICKFLSDNKNWDLKILKDCNIKFIKQANNMTIFMVSGGDCGGAGFVGYQEWKGTVFKYEASGGTGGKGGKIILKKSFSFENNNNYLFNIGQGGSQSSQTGTDSTISKLNGTQLISTDTDEYTQKNGGAGAKGVLGQQIAEDAKDGDDGVEFHNNYYGGGGGGGRNYNSTSAEDFKNGAAGGTGGGGHGYGEDADNENINGETNTGGGGGGGSLEMSESTGQSTYHDAGNGGSGIIIISNYE